MNKKFSGLAAALVFAALSAACVARNVVTRVDKTDKSMKSEGVIYALPRTVINTELPVVETVKTPGKFMKYTKCFFFRPEDKNTPPSKLGIIAEKESSYSLATPVISSRSEPDPQKVFMVKVKGHYLEDKAYSMDWTEDGIMTKGTMETTNRTIDVLVQTAQTVASLAVKAGVVGFQNSDLTDALILDMQARDECKDLVGEVKEGKPDEVRRALNKALDAYDQLLTWQISRAKLVLKTEGRTETPAPPPSAEMLQLAMKETDAQIKLIREMFFGSVTKGEQEVARFALTPSKESWNQPFPLLPFSTQEGVCAPSDLQLQLGKDTSYWLPPKFQCFDPAGKPIFCPCKEAKAEDIKWLSLKLLQADTQFATRLDEAFKPLDDKDKHGFVYRVPAAATVCLFEDKKVIQRFPLLVAQLGATVALPDSTGGRKTSYAVEFHPSGALKNFKLGSEALLQTSTVTGLGTAAGTILDARAKAEQEATTAAAAAATAASDVNQLKKMSELLEACQRLKKAQTDLGQPINLPRACTP